MFRDGLRRWFRRTGSEAAEMPFFDHLEELRWRIIYSLLGLVGGTAVGFILALRLDLLAYLKRPLDPYIDGQQLIALALTDPFFITFKIALTIGFVLAAPVIVWQAWLFLAPALTQRERRSILPALYMGAALFVAGVAIAYVYVLPLTAMFLAGFQTESLALTVTASQYFGFVLKLLVAFGLVFQLPVLILILATLGLVSSRFLSSKRRFAIAGMTITAALMTPGDVASTILMMGPLLLLYELGIVLTKVVERRRARAVAAAADESDTVAGPMAEPVAERAEASVHGPS